MSSWVGDPTPGPINNPAYPWVRGERHQADVSGKRRPADGVTRPCTFDVP